MYYGVFDVFLYKTFHSYFLGIIV